MAIDYSTPIGKLRLLINDARESAQVFTDGELEVFLDLEGDSIKRAAAQALDTIADDEALTSKAIRTQDLTTDGAKVADSLRKRAAVLREQADADDDAGAFVVVDMGRRHHRVPELTEDPYRWPVWP